MFLTRALQVELQQQVLLLASWQPLQAAPHTVMRSSGPAVAAPSPEPMVVATQRPAGFTDGGTGRAGMQQPGQLTAAPATTAAPAGVVKVEPVQPAKPVAVKKEQCDPFLDHNSIVLQSDELTKLQQVHGLEL